MNLFDYKSIIYKTFVGILLLIIVMYVIPQTRYFIHGYASQRLTVDDQNIATRKSVATDAYDVAPVFLKTDEFIAKQKDVQVADGSYVYDYFSDYLIGVTTGNSSSTVRVKLFSDASFKNNFLIEQDATQVEAPVAPLDAGTTTSSSTEPEVIKEADQTYQSYVFEGLGYGQLIAKVPPKTVVKKDSYVYIRTVDGLKPFAKIINVDEDNKSTFTIIYAQLIVSPQNIYKVAFK
ncbi:hypothetical protein H7X65_01115 [Candidatus Parcubacteria bacterium]|nr:hypothetical protein [Candidatus Parcubacteria bacterium]